ncbi:hypothetical protein ACOSQ4_005297 [Xanthoceras sorbifolium]
MAQFKTHFVVHLLLMMLLALEAKTPPGIAKNPSHATCKIKKYKHCYNLVHVCPKFCPDSCTVECASCKPICSAGSTPPPNDDDHSPPDGDGHHSPPASPTPPTPTPSTPSTHPTPTPPTTPSPTLTTPTPSTPSPTPPTPTPPPTPSPTPPTPTPTPSTPSPTPPTPAPPTTTPTPPTTPSTPFPPTSTTPPAAEIGPATARCRNNNYPHCYNMEHVCPRSCPGGCEVDCVTCKPVCRCDRPGAVCQDPRFIGGNGITFYFHGKKDKDFCLVSDSNLHINAHFIGRRNVNMKRDFTWVQSISIFFDNHQLSIAALKTSTWDDSVDRLTLSFDGESVTLSQTDEYSKWQSLNVSVARVGETNGVAVEVKGKFMITAKVVPITEQESRIHNYGITKEDCFAHLDLGFKFYSLSDEMTGVLGQTYRPGYVTRVNMGVNTPVMGGDRDFETSGLFATDCAVSRFNGGFDGEGSASVLDLPSMSCASGIDGKGVVCKR